MGWRVRALCVLAAVVGATCLSAMPVLASGGHTIVVLPGQSIQKAVDSAKPGDTIRIEAGTFNENVLITTDRLTLRGDGAGKTILAPPASDKGCGICVGIPFAPFTKMVTGDRISDLTVRDFAGFGIFGFGSDRLQVTRVDAANNAAYGISRFESTRTVFRNNRAWGSHEAGFYVGDSPDADTLLVGNQAWNNDLGVLVRHAHGVTMRDNNLWANCFGVLVVDDGQAGGAGDIKITENRISGNNQFCPGGDPHGPPPHGGAGVVLLGAVRTTISDNEINNNGIPEVGALGRAGVAVISSAPFFGGSDPINNTIQDNEILDNTQFDIAWDGSGTGNKFLENECNTSAPSGLCPNND